MEVKFPPEGTLITPKFPAPTNMRMFTILRLLGIFCACIAQAVDGKMPADQETIRIWGLHGRDEDGNFFLFREVLGGGSGGRYYADGSDAIHVVPNSRNLPAEFSETRYPVRVEKLALAPDSGGPGLRRGGLGYLKDFRVLKDAAVFSLADRSKLACWGVKDGKAGGTYKLILNPETKREKNLPALCDNVPIKKGDLIRVITTGGGGWGDPLNREPELVQLDVIQGKVSREGAKKDYGVIVGSGEDGPVDVKATETLRKKMRRGRKPSFIDRGEYFEKEVRKKQSKKTAKKTVSV
jgi:N-methylhydantoinase B